MIVDTLTTRYNADTSQYEAGVGRMVRATNNMGNSVGGVVRALGGAVLGGGLIGAARYAVNAATSFDTLQRTLSAVTKSGDRAAQILKFVDKLAVPSIFKSKELAEASVTLEAFGLQTERYLPVVEKLGSIFGGTAQDLDQFTRALGMIRSGRTGEAFESLARAGISRQDLLKRGLQFDKGGALLSGTKQALDAVEAEVNARFGKLSTEMASGPAAKMASVMDQVERGARQAGGAMLQYILPVVTQASDKIEGWVKDGAFKKGIDYFVTRIKELKGPFMAIAATGKALLDTFLRLPAPLQNLLATALVLNKAIGGGLGSGLLGIGKSIGGGVASMAGGGFASGFNLTGLAGTILGPIGIIGASLVAGAMLMASSLERAQKIDSRAAEIEGSLPEFVIETDPATGKKVRRQLGVEEKELYRQAAIEAKKERDRQEKELIKKADIDPVDMYSSNPSEKTRRKKREMQEKLDEIEEQARQTYLKTHKLAGKPVEEAAGQAIDSIGNKMVPVLEQIEANTKPLADFRRMVLGGGPLGGGGVTPVELGGMKHGHGKAQRMIHDAIGMIVQQSVIDALKARRT